MAAVAQQIAEMVELLPENDQALALELVKKLVLAWDPDYTKLTPKEARELEQAMKEVETGETVPFDAINWE